MYAECGIGNSYAYTNPCIHNERDGLESRHKLAIPFPMAEGNAATRSRRLFESRIQSFAEKFRSFGIAKMSMSEYVEKYTGQMKTRYAHALKTYEERGWDLKDSRISSFVKMERVLNYVSDYQLPGARKVDPRLIHPRTPLYNLCLGVYLKPLEQQLKRFRRFGLRTQVKGCSLEQRAEILERHLARAGEDCLIYKVDSSRWDGHVNKYTLQQEHRVYKTVYQGDRNMVDLLNCQYRSVCRSVNGIRYTLESRCSGDVNTSLGNHILNMCMIESYMLDKVGNNRHWSYVCDGDDALIFVRKGTPMNVEGFSEHFRAFGQKVVCEGPVPLRELEFCRSKLYRGPKGSTLVRDPRRVLGGMLTVFKHLNNLPSYYKQIALGETHVSAGVPIVQEFAHYVLNNTDRYVTGSKKEVKLWKSDMDYFTRFYDLDSGAHPMVQYTPEQLVQYLDLWDIDLAEYELILFSIRNFRFQHLHFDW